MLAQNATEQAGGPPAGLQSHDAPARPTRRQVLAGAAGTVAAVALTGLGCAHHQEAASPGPAGGATLASSAKPRNLGKVTDFVQDGPPKFVQIPMLDSPSDKITFIVDNIGDGKFRVLLPNCTHKGCPVAWKQDAGQFVCPCHGGRFDRTGKNISGPPPKPLNSIPARVENGNVMIG